MQGTWCVCLLVIEFHIVLRQRLGFMMWNALVQTKGHAATGVKHDGQDFTPGQLSSLDLFLQRGVCGEFLGRLEPAFIAKVAESLNRMHDAQVFWRFPAHPAAPCSRHQDFVQGRSVVIRYLLPGHIAMRQPSIAALAPTLDEVLENFGGRAGRDAHGLNQKSELNARRRRHLKGIVIRRD